jgi:hypothetical protein
MSQMPPIADQGSSLEQILLASCMPRSHAQKSPAFWQEGMMKIRKPAQLNAASDVSTAILAKHFLDVQRLRDEVLRAELAATAKHQAEQPKHKAEGSIQPPAGSSPQPLHSSIRRSTQQNSQTV